MSEARVVFRYGHERYTVSEGQLLGRIASSPIPFNEDGFVSREHAVLSSRRGRPVLVPVRGRLWRNGREEPRTCGLVVGDRVALSETTELEVTELQNAHRVALVDQGAPRRWVVPGSGVFVSFEGGDLGFLPMTAARPELPRLFEGADEAWHLERPGREPEVVYYGDALTFGDLTVRLEAGPVSGDPQTRVRQGLDVKMYLDEPDEPGHTHVVGVTDVAGSAHGPLRGRSHRLWSRVVVLQALRGGAVHRDDILRAVWGPGVKPHTFDQTKSVLNRNCGVLGLRPPLTNQRPGDAPGTWRLDVEAEDRFTIGFDGRTITFEELTLGASVVLPAAEGAERAAAWREVVASAGPEHRLKALLRRVL